MDLVDFFGRKFRVGDFVVYPGRKGSHLWMSGGEIIEIKGAKLIIKKKYGNWKKTNDEGYRWIIKMRKVTLSNLSNVIIELHRET